MRDGDWIWMHKSILFSQYISDSAYRVYAAISAFSGVSDQRSWPSISLIASKVHMSKTTVVKAIKLLVACKLIRIEKTTGASNVYFLLNCKEIHAPAVEKANSPHHRLIKFFHDTTMEFRGIKPVWRQRDVAQLKKMLALGILSETDTEKLMLYFLAHPNLKKYSPSMSTFFSSGIFNGLMNAMRNNKDFWKDLDRFSERIGRKVEQTRDASLPGRVSDILKQLSVDKKLQEEYGAEGR